MKKLVLILLVAVLLLTSGCSYSVPDPMKYPDYTFDETPTTMELRQTAVQAMHDILSIQWHTKKEIVYRKTGPVSQKQFIHEPRETYAGLLYSTANTGLFQFLEFYNYETGCLEYEGTADELKLQLGSSCADALLWAWSTVCNSISGGFYPVLMVPKNGYCIVGDYTYNFSVPSYNEMPSYHIIDNNPKETIMAAYAATLPADALVTTSDNHAMMVIEAPTVVYLEDGSIDAANSYIMIQDQRAGGSTFYDTKVNGRTLHYSGRTSAKYTFDKLYEEDFVPVTTAEFLGTKAYDKAAVSVTGDSCTTLDALKAVTVEANYPLVSANIIKVNDKGEESVVAREIFGGSAMQGAPRTFDLKNMKALENVSAETGSVIKLEVVVATGERFIPIEFSI